MFRRQAKSCNGCLGNMQDSRNKDIKRARSCNVISLSIPVSGHGDVGGREGLFLCQWCILPLCCPEAAAWLCLFSWVPDIQLHEATWQLPVYAWAASGTGPLQDPSITGVSLVPQASL